MTPDQVAGTLLSRTGDLADANTRLQRAGVRRELRSILRSVGGGDAVLEHVWTGAATPGRLPERRRLRAPSPRRPGERARGRPAGRGLRGAAFRARGGPRGKASSLRDPRRRGGRGSRRERLRRSERLTSPGTGRRQGGTRHRCRARSGSQPRGSPGRRGRRHRRDRRLRGPEGGPLPARHSRGSRGDRPPGRRSRAAGWSPRRSTSATPTGWPAAVSDGAGRLGGLDIAVANVGVCTVQRWDEVDPAVWDTVVGINLTGTWNTCVAAIPHLRATRRRIDGADQLHRRTEGTALLRSVRGIEARRGRHHAGARQRARRRRGSGSTRCTRPGSTRRCSPASEPSTERIAAQPEVGSLFLNSLPVDVVAPDDVSAAVLYLSSDEARYVTGITLSVDAGAAAR